MPPIFDPNFILSQRRADENELENKLEDEL